MISKRFGCVFVHVPKTAGQSIARLFLDLHGLTWKNRESLLMRFNPDPALGPERLAHLTAAEYTRLNYLTEAEFQSLFKFSFVRNPWSRLVSEYTCLRMDLEMSFADFVSKSLALKETYTDRSRHIIPQYDYLYDEAGTCLVDFVGRFERLQEGFDTVCDKLGIPRTELSHINKSGTGGTNLWRRLKALLHPPLVKRPYQSYYDPALVDRVGEFYAKDVATFGYRYEG